MDRYSSRQCIEDRLSSDTLAVTPSDSARRAALRCGKSAAALRCPLEPVLLQALRCTAT